MLATSPRGRREHGASRLLVGVLLFFIFANVCASLTVGNRCPHYLVCANEGRHFCKSGSSHCGSCLSPLVENTEGHCVENKHHRRHDKVSYPELDEEIDYLHAVIEKQEVSVAKPKLSKLKVNTSSQKEEKFFDAAEPKQSSQDRLLPNVTQTTKAHASGAPTPPTRSAVAENRAGPQAVPVPVPTTDTSIVITIILCVTVGIVVLIISAVCFVRFRKESRLAQKVDYPAFGGASIPVVPANGTSFDDKTLIQSAQMYHYQHQKQQMLSMGKHKNSEPKITDSEFTSDDETVGEDFTVYECPGLAPTGEMEVKNPLFDDSTLNYQGYQK